MVILKFIMGSIIVIYLMVIGSGHLTTKNAIAVLKGEGSYQEMQQDNSCKNHFDDNSG